MDLVQHWIVTDVERLPAFYVRLVRTMIFRDPSGNLINVSSPAEAAPG